jgi:hypothetical protein
MRQLGLQGRMTLPGNDEIEAELRAYRSLYQADEHPVRIASLLRIALDAMRALERFRPYLTGPVLKGTAGPYAEIDLQLFPESPKEVELFLLDQRMAYETHEVTRYSGDRARAVAVLALGLARASRSSFRYSIRATSAWLEDHGRRTRVRARRLGRGCFVSRCAR